MKPARRGYAAITLATVCLLTAACTPKDPNRKLTIPVIGEVYVDGSPAAMLQIEAHPPGGIDKQQPTVTHGITGEDGKFALATYEAGDGVPPGQYKLTFRWQEFNVISAGYSGPDKLKKRYDDAEKSEITLTVEKGPPIDLGRIELSTN